MMSQTAIEIERMTITLDNPSTRTSSLSVSPFRRIREDLRKAERLDELPFREVHAWWQDLQGDFQRLSKNHQDYLREFYGPGMEMQMKSGDFILYKQHLIRYLEEVRPGSPAQRRSNRRAAGTLHPGTDRTYFGPGPTQRVGNPPAPV